MSGDDALGGRFKRGEYHRPMFFKVFIRQYNSDRMLIPKGFMEGIMKQEEEGCASLVGPSGEKWRVSIIKKEAKWFIDEGWKVFWEDNSIAETDFLVFTYAGKMKFYVKIFGPHGCQKPSAHLAKCTKDNRSTFTASQQKVRVPEKKPRGRPHLVTAEERRVADLSLQNIHFLLELCTGRLTNHQFCICREVFSTGML
uniref:TF-B3 domain-containing protein n=1 Tax=Kalanchoe fedtschenkoi TaxID=63787 RepID=A0A7N0VHN5_KALFE